MGVTININGLSLVHKGSGGVSNATLPDVCYTPTGSGPVPIPYPNTAYSKDLAKGSETVSADGGNSCAIFGSEFSVSTGDESGTQGGILSGTYTKEATWISFSFDVKIEGKGACRLSDKMWHNHLNTLNASGVKNPEIQAMIDAMCEIYCQVKKEGEAFKKKHGKTKRFDYSKRAKELAEKHPKLKGLAFERKMFVAIENTKSKIIKAARDAGRKVWGMDAIKKRLGKQLAKRVGKTIAVKAAKKAVLKFIPVVNVISLAWDVYDAASLGVEAYNLINQWATTYDPAKVTTFEIQPDMAQLGPDGEATEIFDWKFDRDAMVADNGDKLGGYQDSMSNSQRQLYTEKTGGKKPHIIDKTECKKHCK